MQAKGFGAALVSLIISFGMNVRRYTRGSKSLKLQFFFVLRARSGDNYFFRGYDKGSFCRCGAVEHFFHHGFKGIDNRALGHVFSFAFNLV